MATAPNEGAALLALGRRPGRSTGSQVSRPARRAGPRHGGEAGPAVFFRTVRERYQAIAPCRSRKAPVGPSLPMVASATIASVPSVTVCGPLWPLKSVAV
ncbi:hypothetical protein BG846_01662 [Streptomyces fradiae ATCC 10745 = DSM 40063]|uniref:Uncharacterized protein n=1 Tax=Streptomyces fradiae ATCC 10745 = DSM 40063 TaxID=1319510 RepID=A0A1Y2NYR4_STRFR|nr:hypothetical protein BG846_01662 [Streptomyces fradiae ATCC 10745 = DSM 40063]